MTQEEIERLKALAEAATPGPWVEFGAAVQSAYEEPHFDEQLTIADCDMDVRIDHDTRATSNAAFIAAARDALPRLIAELEAARAENASLRERPSALDRSDALFGAALDDVVAKADVVAKELSDVVYVRLLEGIQSHLRDDATWNLANDIRRCDEINRRNAELVAKNHELQLQAQRDQREFAALRERLERLEKAEGVMAPRRVQLKRTKGWRMPSASTCTRKPSTSTTSLT